VRREKDIWDTQQPIRLTRMGTYRKLDFAGTKEDALRFEPRFGRYQRCLASRRNHQAQRSDYDREQREENPHHRDRYVNHRWGLSLPSKDMRTLSGLPLIG
jgi:hypothetical protein